MFASTQGTDSFYNFSIFSEPEVDAQVRVEGHGGSLRGGDEHRHQHPEEQPGVSASPGRKQG